MADETTYKVETSGSGSAFQTIVRAYAPGAGRFDGKAVDKRDGFSSRPEAAKWGRDRVRELRGLPPTGKPNGCRNCRWADKSGAAARGPWRCVFPVPPMPPLPEALTNAMTYRNPADVSRNGIWADSGTTCPTWAEQPKD